MNFSFFTRAAGAAVLSYGLAACVDVSMEVEVLGEDQAQVTTIFAMAREMYDMGQAQGGNDEFCDADGEMEIGEEMVSCTTVIEGDFATVMPTDESGEPQPTITLVSPGVVRVTFPTASLSDEFGGGEEQSDPETAAMMQAMFAGRMMTLRVSGGRIVESNMEIAEDGRSAVLEIPFESLIDGTAVLPEESFAVVDLN